MGRQVYLDRIAFGRSAFEPANVQEVPFPVAEERDRDIDSIQDEAHGLYVQHFDASGHPVNHRSRELGRRLREAQNDCLAAIGAVQRKSDAGRSTAQADPSADLDLKENECGDEIAHGMRLAALPARWWFGVLKNRLLVNYAFPEKCFTEVLIDEYRHDCFHAFRSVPSSVLDVTNVAYFLQVTGLDRLYDSVLYYLGIPRRERRGNRVKMSSFLGIGALSLFCAPFQYHSTLVQIGLVDSLLPSWKAWQPGSRYSPIPTISSWQGFLLSPMVISIVSSGLSRILRSLLSPTGDMIASNIIQPTNSANYKTIADRERQGPDPLFPYRFPILSQALSFVGWGYAYTRMTVTLESRRSNAESSVSTDRVGFATSANNLDHIPNEISRRQSDVPQASPRLPSAEEVVLIERVVGQDQLPLPSARSNVNLDPADFEPSVRITSRDDERGHVELEIHLPGDHTDYTQPDWRQRMLLARDASTSVQAHKVSHLSCGPARYLASFVHRFIVKELCDMPYRLFATPFTVLYFMHTPSTFGDNPLHSVTLYQQVYGSVKPGTLLNVAANLALCTALEYAFYSTLWGWHYTWTTSRGRRDYGWGRL